MKLFKFIVPFIGIAAVGCTSISVDQVQDNPGSKAETRTFICSIGSPDSKVVTDASGKTQWEVGDEILVHGEYIGTTGGKQYSTIVTLTAGDISLDKKTATISFDVDPDGVAGIVPYDRAGEGYENLFYAIYPASAAVSTNGYHIYYYSEFTRTNDDLMIAYDKDDKFVFTHVCSAIAFKVPDIDGNPATNDFDSYIFSGNKGEIVGYETHYTARYLYKSGAERMDFPYNGSSPHNCTDPMTEITGPVVCDGSTLNFVYIPIPVGKSDNYFEEGFTIKFVKGGDIVKYIKTSTEFTLNRQDFLNIGSIPTDSRLKDYVDPHVCSLSIESDDYDLYSINGNKNANCYIVYPTGANASKVYRFKAVQGNSSTAVSPSSVDVVWETYNDATDAASINVIDDVDYDENYIYFKMPESPHAGNALIAARNALNEVLWSWHIWVPLTTVTDGAYSGFAGANIMDRNLGALVITEAADASPSVQSFGLYYQWGRKDPFIGAREFKDYPSQATVAGSSMSKIGALITMDYAIAHPTTYAYVPEADNSNWIDTPANAFWDNAGSKSIYDPCPQGYRVPTYTNDPMWTATDDGWTWNKSDATKFWFRHDASNVVFPISGYIDCWGGSLTSSDKRSIIWSATNYDDTQGRGAFIRWDKTSVYYTTKVAKAKAGSVRCVAE